MFLALEAEHGNLAGEAEEAGHGTLKHEGWGGQTEPALLQALLRAELSLSQGQIFVKKYTFFSCHAA